MEMESSGILGEGEDSHSMGQLLLCDEALDGPLVMSSPVASPTETLTVTSPPAGFGSQPEISSEGQQPASGSPADLTASTSNQPLLLTYGPSEPPLWRQLQNQHCDNPVGFSPLTSRVMPSGVGAGLRNLGLTCFVNAVLQCLTHTVPLVRSLRSLDHASPCDRAREDFCLLCALRDHIEASLDSSGGIISPVKIVDNLKRISSYFERHQQEDAHEFQQAMMDKLERCCLDQKRDPNLPPLKNIVDEVFGGRLISKLQCCNCGHCSCTYEPLIDLSLEIDHAETLTAALESFTNVEKMEDPESKFRCQNCSKDVSVEKQLLVEKEPTVAALHLKRFKSDSVTVEKIDKHVPFPLELDLGPFTSSHESDVELKYQLYAVVVHMGISPTWGHYLSFVQSSPGIWHKFDDSKVVRVQEEFVLSEDAYILFYAKHGTPWFSSLMGERKTIEDNLISGTSPKSVLDKVDTLYTPYLAFSNVESSACHETADNSSGISVPTLILDKVHSHYTLRPVLSNFVSSSFHKAAGMGITAPFYSGNCFDTVTEESRVNEGGTNGDDCHNHGLYVLRVDENFHTLTPSVSSAPEAHSFQGINPSERFVTSSSVPVHVLSEASNRSTTLRHHRKTEQSNCRRQLSKSLEDSKKKEAVRYMRGMPTGRAFQLYNAMVGPRSPGSKKRVAKQRVGASLCERVRSSSVQHRSRCNRSIFPAILR